MPPTSKNTSNTHDNAVFVDEEVEPQVLSMIQNATKHVTFVTPYLSLWGHLETAIDKAISRGVGISFIIRPGEKQSTEDQEWLFGHKVKLYELPNLHAKIYINESTVLISSMNITEHSTTNSLEFAMIVRSENDATRIRNYVSDLMRRAEPIQFVQSEGQETGQVGACIRCRQQIYFNAARPLCDNCYQLWAEYGNEDYAERYCHSCGKPSLVTYAKPLCGTCYQKER